MAYRSVEIANAFLDLAGSAGLTQMQLQKLVFIANGWNLALSDEALVGENPQAWLYGPVYVDLYDHTKFFGKAPITRKITPDDDQAAHFFLDQSSDKRPYSSSLTSREKQVLAAVWKRYGAVSGAKLSTMTHQAGTPWTETYNGGKGRNAPIELDLIKKHYDGLAKRVQQAA